MGDRGASGAGVHGTAEGRETPSLPGRAPRRAAADRHRPVPAGSLLAATLVGWLCGVGAQLTQASLWPATVYAAGPLLWLAALLLVTLRCGVTRAGAAPSLGRPGVFAPVFTLVLAAAAGGGWAGTLASVRLADRLDPALEGVDLEIVGVVAGLPQFGPDGVRFGFEVERARRPGGEAVALPSQLALGWYRGWERTGSRDDRIADLAAGQRWRFVVRLRAPHGASNPYGFDQELWLFEQGFGATGTVRDDGAAAPALVARDVAHPIDRWRQAWRDRVLQAVPDGQQAGVLAALAVGDQAAIDRADWDVFRATGVAHLVSISGLHVTMLAWLGAAAVGRLWRRSAQAMHVLPAPVAARWGGLAVAAGYALLAGWGVPAQRTVWMLAVVTLLASSGRRWPWPAVLGAAAVVVTLADPWALLQPGLWLSFVAVGVLLASGGSGPVDGAAGDTPAPQGAMRRAAQAVWRAAGAGVRTQLTATIALAPLTLVCFQQLSLVGFVANLIAIPLVTLVVTPLALIGLAVPPAWALAAWLLQGLMALLAPMAAWPYASATFPVADAWAQALGLVAGAIAVLPLPRALRLLALPMVLPLLLPAVVRPAPGTVELLAADVGQGTAVLLRTHAHLLVYDAGPRYGHDSDAGGRVLVPLLRARGERQVDRLVLSHKDLDHVGGAQALIDAVPVRRLSSSLPPDHPLIEAVPSAVPCRDGERWSWDGVDFEFLHPTEAQAARETKPNAVSCVLQVRAANGSVLLTGDIEREQELALVARHGERLRSDVLVVPHHGSRTSSTAALLDAVRPQLAIVQAGYRNRFGHPAPDVLERYRSRAIMVAATPACGAFLWGLGPSRCHRVQQRRYWHHVLEPPSLPPSPAS